MSDIDRLLGIMATLRDPERGCPWDRAQSFASVAPYTLEEAYEVADAIARNDLSALREELGDLLFQVVFHSRIAEEAGQFAFNEVIDAICDKMISRHPHVFAQARSITPAEQSADWEQHKHRERVAKQQHQRSSVLDDVPLSLPALTRAAKLGRRAAAVGFEWTQVSGALNKLTEEISELNTAIAEHAPQAEIAAELGDVLFCLVNVSRHLKIDPEAALRGTNQKFERRFRHIERRLHEQGRTLPEASLKEMDAYWDEAKLLERANLDGPG